MKEGKDLFLAIDANAIIHRAYHAFPATLSNSEGQQVNAVFGFASMLLKVLEEFKPKYVVCAFDTPKPTFRHTMYVEYKAQRKPTDRELIDQFPLVEELLNAFNIPIVKKEGFEADDILGTLAETALRGKWQEYGLNMVIVSGDRDLLQLVEGSVKVCLPVGSFKNLALYDRDLVKETFGFFPDQVIDYKSLVGDTSDNIPGVKGIGEKSALDLLEKYGHLDNIYKNLTELKPRVQKLLGEGVEQAEMSKVLATISRDVSGVPNLEDALLKDFEREKVLEIFKKFEFRSLVDKIPESAEVKRAAEDGQMDMFIGGQVSSQSNPGGQDIQVANGDSSASMNGEHLISSIIIQTEKEFDSFTHLLKKSRYLNTLYLSKEESADGNLYLGFGIEDGEAGVDNLGKQLSYLLPVEWVELCKFEGKLRECFTTSGECETVFYNWEQFCAAALKNGIQLNAASFDLALISHLVSSGAKGNRFGDLAYKCCGKTFPEKLAPDHIHHYLSVMGDIAKELKSKLKEIAEDEVVSKFLLNIKEPTLKQNGDTNLDYLAKGESETSLVLAKMEARGILLDYKRLEGIKDELEKDIRSEEEAVFHSVGHEFNLNSPKQLAEVLYDELHLPAGRGKTGRTTQEAKLTTLKVLHPAITHVLNYRELSKLQNTYVIPFLNEAAPLVEKGELPLLHTDFQQLGASSGRFSSINPNLQNLPARGEWATKFREVFIPRPGMTLVSIDYSQIDLRVMAHVSQDQALIQDFIDEKDIHLETAARIFNKDKKLVTSDERGFGKTINFGILYGQTKYGLSRTLGISFDDAEKYITKYFENYKGVAQYVNYAMEKAQDVGFVQTLMGRRRYIAGLAAKNRNIREAAIREAINMPIQGGSADIMKLAMLGVDKLIESKYKDKVWLLLQVHDELVCEVLDRDVEHFLTDAITLMENVVQLDLPLKVGGSKGENMAQLK